MTNEDELEKISKTLEDILYLVKRDILECWKKKLNNEEPDVTCEDCDYSPICDQFLK